MPDSEYRSVLIAIAEGCWDNDEHDEEGEDEDEELSEENVIGGWVAEETGAVF